jgi:acetaldehyde dehydrogenase (acetylating)
MTCSFSALSVTSMSVTVSRRCPWESRPIPAARTLRAQSESGSPATTYRRLLGRPGPVRGDRGVDLVRSAGPVTRANIDEFTETTAAAIESVGGAGRGKAVIILNPVKPPMIMRDTVFCAIPADADTAAITASVEKRVAEGQEYVPGYTLRAEPQYDDPREDWNGMARVAVFLEVRGNGDYLPPWAGNLDIMTAAAARTGEQLTRTRKAAA